MDTILFFKVGKFYELFHMDADVGMSELDLIYMKGMTTPTATLLHSLTHSLTHLLTYSLAHSLTHLFTHSLGEKAHSGFPEISYGKFAAQLVAKGYRVARVEQTETPEMLKERNDSKGKGTKDKVVKREMCSIMSKVLVQLLTHFALTHSLTHSLAYSLTHRELVPTVTWTT